MICISNELPKYYIDMLYTLPDSYKYINNETVIFDIETTGFSPSNCITYLIGYIFFEDNKGYYSQLFARNKSEEIDIITTFVEFLSNKRTLVHFNGNGFDIPFLKNKCFYHKISNRLNELESIDLYKSAAYLKNILKTPNIKQKTIEEFFDVKRKDALSGGELIKIYEEYQKNPSDDMLELMLLHNREDIFGVIELCQLDLYSCFINGLYSIKSTLIQTYKDMDQIDNKELFFELELPYSLPKRISYGYGPFYINAYNKTARMRVKIYTQELKFFYPNYKDYFYLPEEDRSIHKSVAFYVDKDFRTKAKAANCYSKKTGLFLPQEEDIINPYFKVEYNDKITYFEATDNFLASDEDMKMYIQHIFNQMIKPNKIKESRA